MVMLRGLMTFRRVRAALTAACSRRNEAGQGMVEYALILMLMALVVIVLLSVVGRETNNVFSNIATGLAQ